MTGTSYTSGLRLTNQPEGGNANTWGTIADNNFEFLDDAITGILSVDMTGGSSKTLTTNNGSDDEARNMVLIPTGVMTSANSVIIPASEKVYCVHAKQTGASVTLRTSSGTGVTFATGNKAVVYCDGTSVWQITTPLVSALDPSNNLSDLGNAATARTNLGLATGMLATTSAGFGTLVSGTQLEIDMTKIYPVGSIYMNAAVATNPGTLLGFGTWVALGQGRVLLGAGQGTDINGVTSTFTATSAGGEYQHTLTAAEMPAVSVKFTGTVAADGDSGLAIYTNPVFSGGSQGSVTNKSWGVVQGSGSAMPLMPPWLCVYMWKRTA